MSLSSLGEFGLIDRLHSKLKTRPGVVLGIGDDGAVLEPLVTPVVTVDALVEGVHFRRDWMTAGQLGRKAMAVNISDLAAMGAVPRAAFVCLAIAPDEDLGWVEELYAGFETMAREFNFTVAGGDTVKSAGPVTLGITLVGELMEAARGPVLRSGAMPGDLLYVTGTLGGAAAGLHLLSHPEIEVPPADRETVLRRHFDPAPRLGLMQMALMAWGDTLHGALDLSDGLGGDAGHLAARSGLRVEIETTLLPLGPECLVVASAAGVDAMDWALGGGEDYELLLAVDPRVDANSLATVGAAAGTPLTLIGECRNGAAEVRLLKNALPLPWRGGFRHF